MRPRYRLQAGTRGTYLSPRGSSVFSAGGIALVQSASGTTADGSAGLPVPFGVPVTAANSVLSFLSFDYTSEDGFAVVPALVGGGAAEMIIEIDATAPGNVAKAYILSKGNVAGDETGVQFFTVVAVRANNTIAEYSGLANAAAESTATNTATSTTLAIGTITPTSANNLLTAIFAFNADVTVVGIANDVLVTGIGAGVYTYRGQADLGDGLFPFFNLEGQPTDGPNDGNAYCISTSTGIGWSITGVGASPLNDSTNESSVAFPWLASWTGSTVTELPGWALVGTRTGGSSVWQYVYQKIQTSADASNPTIVLSGSADIAGAAAAFGGV